MSEEHADDDVPFDAGEPAEVKKRAKSAKDLQNERDEMVRGLMSMPEGRRWVYYLLERCHVFQSSFSSNAMTMAFQEGERNVGLIITADVMRAAPNKYMDMVREAEERNDRNK